MQAQINADHNDENHKVPADQIGGVMATILSRISDHITRVNST